jgi:hypothetical protein
MSDEIAEFGSVTQLIEVASATRQEFDIWWDRIGYDDPFERLVESRGGHSWTLLEALERAVWHTAQHTRQVQYFLENALEINPREELTAEILAGLPLPDGIHA